VNSDVRFVKIKLIHAADVNIINYDIDDPAVLLQRQSYIFAVIL